MSYGAASGVAVDIDERSLAAARRTLAPYPAMEVMKCSAYELPWTDEFDVTFSIGVIHHLEFPVEALKAMLKATKPAGDVAIWGRENNGWLLWGLNPARKILFSRMPIAWVHAIALLPTALLCFSYVAASTRSSISACCERFHSRICDRSYSIRCCRASRTIGAKTKSRR